MDERLEEETAEDMCACDDVDWCVSEEEEWEYDERVSFCDVNSSRSVSDPERPMSSW